MSKSTTSEQHWTPDIIAGLTTGIADIPDAMASAILAGTNPVYGLYALMVGTPVGGLLTSSQFMTVATTSAMALIVGSALSGLAADDQIAALANYWECPVLTNDSDFLIYDLQAGVILLDYLNLDVRSIPDESDSDQVLLSACLPVCTCRAECSFRRGN